MKKLRLTALSFSCFASLLTSSYAIAEVDFALGLGSQFGLAPGVKIIKQSEEANFYGVVGLGSIGLGFEMPIADSNHTTFGLTGVKGFDLLFDEYDIVTANFNYHFSGYRESGFMVGLDLGYIKAEDFLGFDEADGESAFIGISLGYKF